MLLDQVFVEDIKKQINFMQSSEPLEIDSWFACGPSTIQLWSVLFKVFVTHLHLVR